MSVNAVDKMEETQEAGEMNRFPWKTYELIDHCHQNDPETACWKDDMAFIVKNKAKFERDYLPQKFGHSNFTSFVRQLNKYGFTKVPRDGSGCRSWESYQHENFRRGEQHLLRMMRRARNVANSGQVCTSGSSNSKHHRDELASIQRKLEQIEFGIQSLGTKMQSSCDQIVVIHRKVDESAEALNSKLEHFMDFMTKKDRVQSFDTKMRSSCDQIEAINRKVEESAKILNSKMDCFMDFMTKEKAREAATTDKRRKCIDRAPQLKTIHQSYPDMDPFPLGANDELACMPNNLDFDFLRDTEHFSDVAEVKQEQLGADDRMNTVSPNSYDSEIQTGFDGSPFATRMGENSVNQQYNKTNEDTPIPGFTVEESELQHVQRAGNKRRRSSPPTMQELVDAMTDVDTVVDGVAIPDETVVDGVAIPDETENGDTSPIKHVACRRHPAVSAIFLFVAAVAIALAVKYIPSRDQERQSISTAMPSSGDSMKKLVGRSDELNTSGKSERYNAMLSVLATVSSKVVLEDQATPQHKALVWLADTDTRFLEVTDSEAITQRHAVATVFFSTRGESWIHKCNFLSAEHECAWRDYVSDDGASSSEKGVFCYDNEEVVDRIVLPRNNLTGTLPDGLYVLSRLQELILGGNKLAGTIPNWNFTKLTALYLEDNRLSGPIETVGAGNLTSLQSIRLSENLFTGTLPDAIGHLRHVQELALQNNQLSGKIPATIGNLIDLKWLRLSNNLFNGTIPLPVWRLKNLEALFLDNNRLSGPIEHIGAGNLTKLLSMKLSKNLFTGTLPDMGDLVRLEELALMGNSFNGTVPQSFARLEHLDVFNLANTSITGDLSFLCWNNFTFLIADCYGDDKEVQCECCTACCSDFEESNKLYGCFDN